MAILVSAPQPSELDALHRGFLAAFADYLVPMQLGREAFAKLIGSRGISWPLSRVARDGGEIVGFWLTGTDDAVAEGGGDPRALVTDIATGVVPAHRGTALAGRLWGEVEEALVAAGYRACGLEVIDGNERAIARYRRLGFAATRTLDCWFLPAEIAAVGAPPGIAIAAEPRPEWQRLHAWWEWQPAWPGRPGSVARAGDDAVTLVARQGGEAVGYATVLRSASNVAQLAVAPAHRRRGIGSALLAAAARELAPGAVLRFLNVPADATGTAALLAALGAAMRIRQLEMVRTLPGG